MKKSIIFLSIVLISFTHTSIASVQIFKTHNGLFAINGVTPLCMAISRGDVAFVKKLIEYGADINEKSNGMTPLMIAARYNCAEIVELLLAKGADISAKDDKGFTALKYAKLSNAAQSISILTHFKQ